MKRVLMVCTGNICRSTMAHQILLEAARDAGIDIVVDSAGVSDEEEGNPVDRRAARVLREHGHEVPNHRARQIRMSELADWDLILAMTGHHLSALNRLRDHAGLRADAASDSRGSAGPDIRLFRDFDPQATPSDHDVPDPWYGGYQDFVETLETIERTTPFIVEELSK